MQKLLEVLRNPSSLWNPPVPHPAPHGKAFTLPWFTRGDLDGFFGLFADNLLQLMLIGTLCKFLCGFPSDFITSRVLPGAALSILLGNLFYALQARKLALKTKRTDVTALPFGINTPSLIAFIVLIMAPIYLETHNYQLAWQAGLFACFLNGLMEIGGAYAGDWLRQNTPRAALLCALAGVAITFIAMGFIFQIFANPLVGVLPMLLILLFYTSRVKLPFSLPGGFVAVAVGTLLAWVFRGIGVATFQVQTDPIQWGLYLPHPVPGDLFSLLFSSTGWKYLAVIFPMGLFNVIGSLQNLESAEAAGDRYPTKPSLMTNGVATLLAGFLGSPFPTTIYIGHPGWKAMGARHGYSILNGAIITLLCLVGGVSLFLKIIPQECILGILLWIAIIITAQAFQEIPKEHSLAVAFGLIPAFAAFTYEMVLKNALLVANIPLANVIGSFESLGLHIRGILFLNQGFLLTSMIFAAILVFMIERKYLKAAQWCFAAAGLAFVGVIHGYKLTVEGGLENKFGFSEASKFGIVYAIVGGVLLLLHYKDKLSAKPPRKKKGKKADKDDPGLNKVNNVSYV